MSGSRCERGIAANGVLLFAVLLAPFGGARITRWNAVYPVHFVARTFRGGHCACTGASTSIPGTTRRAHAVAFSCEKPQDRADEQYCIVEGSLFAPPIVCV